MKKVLIISYYWPPAGGISVHRSLKISKYLRSFGWEPIVYIPKNAAYPYLDEGNYKDIPEGITILSQPILEPFTLFKKLTGRKKEDSLNNIVHVRDKKASLFDKLGIWVRGNLFIPDARSLWIKPSVRYLKKYLKENPVEALFTDGPPHTNTAIACELKKATGIPWLSDFQDPWTQVDYYQLFPISKWADRKHKKMEQEAFKQANQITIVSPTWKRDLESIGARNVEVIYWGYDEDDFKDLQRIPDQKFSIVHSGLLGFDRNPENLFRVLAKLKADIPGFEQDLHIKLSGQVDYAVKEVIDKYGLTNYVTFQGIIPRETVLQDLINAQVLLLLLNKAVNAKGRLPGKLFEYIGSQRPILAIGEKGSDAEYIIKDVNSGSLFSYDDEDSLEVFIKELYLNYKEGNLAIDQSSKSSTYTIKAQTQKIATFLDQISSSHG